MKRIDCPVCGHFAHRKNACNGGMGDCCDCPCDSQAKEVALFRDYFGMEIPEGLLDLGFEDVSWHNDASAHMVHEKLKLELWVAEDKQEEREFPQMKKYLLCQLVDAEATSHETESILVETEDVGELVAYVKMVQEFMPDGTFTPSGVKT